MLYTNNPINTATILGIDPGSESLGVAKIDFYLDTLAVAQVYSSTYLGSKLGMNQWMANVHSPRFARINAHHHNLLQVLRDTQPIAVVSESPFFNSRFPQAYGALTEVVTAIRQAVWDYDPNVQLELVDPPRVKRAVNAPGNAKKDEVHNAVLSISEIAQNFQGPTPLEDLDEHSIDAIAVAYFQLKQYRGI